jgi:hypothetical protein
MMRMDQPRGRRAELIITGLQEEDAGDEAEGRE